MHNEDNARTAHDVGDGVLNQKYVDGMLKRLPKIVLTGGPCCGKSSIVEELGALCFGDRHCAAAPVDGRSWEEKKGKVMRIVHAFFQTQFGGAT